MSFDPNQTDVDREVDASMRMFERAKVGPAEAIVPRTLHRILVCSDGSSQHEAIEDAATFLRSRYADAEIRLLDGREATENAPAPMEWKVANAQTTESDAETAYEKILNVTEDFQPDLVVVPCPFGRDFEAIGADSAGTVIDVLLRRCTAPMLVIRGGDQALVNATKEIVLVVGSENESEPAAAALALSFASSESELTLNLVISKEQVENIRQLMAVLAPEQKIDREKLAGALVESHAQLDLALHKGALDLGVNYRMDPQQDVTYAGYMQRPLLVVVPLEQDDNFGHGFVQDRVRNSPHPVLVVPRA